MSRPNLPIANSDTPIATLDHLGFQVFAPHPHLRPWVQCYWTVQQPHLPDTGYTENLYPDGGTTLIFYFTPGERPMVRFNAYQTLNTMYFRGSLDRMGIRLHPGGAFQLLRLLMPELIDADHASQDLNLHHINNLQDQLADAPDVSQRLNLIDDWLLQQSAQQHARRGVIQHVLPDLSRYPDSIDTLSNRANISLRQLERKFKQEVGLTPVQLKKLQRVKIARRLITLHPEIPLVDVAQHCGFYDQAHFIRDFHKITRQTPGHYRDKKMSKKYNPR